MGHGCHKCGCPNGCECLPSQYVDITQSQLAEAKERKRQADAQVPRETWDDFFMKMAELMATRSKDPSTKVGSVIADYHHRVIGLGYNGFPRYVTDSVERYEDKMVKYNLIVHAEANAILNCIVKPSDVTLYSTMFPCSQCAKLIIQAGIARVICPQPRTEGKWADDAEFSKQMLNEAQVMVYGPNYSWHMHENTTRSGRI